MNFPLFLTTQVAICAGSVAIVYSPLPDWFVAASVYTIAFMNFVYVAWYFWRVR